MVTWTELTLTFLVLGTTCWGGVYASLARVEKVLVERRRWLTHAELHSLLALATLVPGPTFVALGGLVGYRLRGLRGAAIGCAMLLLPSALIILVLMMLLPPAWAEAGMGMVGRAVGIAVGGVLLGTAVRGAQRAGQWRRGLPLAAAVALAILLGVPILLAILTGLVAGRFLLPDPVPAEPEPAEGLQ